ncbi:hypothetical protein, partial [Parachitinimonas caeni]
AEVWLGIRSTTDTSSLSYHRVALKQVGSSGLDRANWSWEIEPNFRSDVTFEYQLLARGADGRLLNRQVGYYNAATGQCTQRPLPIGGNGASFMEQNSNLHLIDLPGVTNSDLLLVLTGENGEVASVNAKANAWGGLVFE